LKHASFLPAVGDFIHIFVIGFEVFFKEGSFSPFDLFLKELLICQLFVKILRLIEVWIADSWTDSFGDNIDWVRVWPVTLN
jgi:hypothetical protein